MNDKYDGNIREYLNKIEGKPMSVKPEIWDKMKQVVRERETEATVRKNDAADNVEWVHQLEDENEELKVELDNTINEVIELMKQEDLLRANIEALTRELDDYKNKVEYIN